MLFSVCFSIPLPSHLTPHTTPPKVKWPTPGHWATPVTSAKQSTSRTGLVRIRDVENSQVSWSLLKAAVSFLRKYRRIPESFLGPSACGPFALVSSGVGLYLGRAHILSLYIVISSIYLGQQFHGFFTSLNCYICLSGLFSQAALSLERKDQVKSCSLPSHPSPYQVPHWEEQCTTLAHFGEFSTISLPPQCGKHAERDEIEFPGVAFSRTD